MNKKFRILMLTLILLSGSSYASNYSASTLNAQTYGVFSSVGDFFGNLVSGNSASAKSTTEREALSSKTVSDKDTKTISGSSMYAKNVAIGCDSTDATDCDNGVGVIEYDSKVSGIEINKTMEATSDSGYVVPGDAITTPATQSDEITIGITVRNTGASVQDVTVTDPWLDPLMAIGMEDQVPPVNVSIQASQDANNDMAVKNTPANEILTDTTSTPPTHPIVSTHTATELNDGITILNMDTGDIVTFTMKMRVNPSIVSLLPAGIVDYTMKNRAEACHEFDNSGIDMTDPDEVSGYIHVNETTGVRDGQVFADATSSTGYTLCNDDTAEIGIDGNGDGIVDGIDEIWVRKSIEDTTAAAGTTANNNIAEPGETLTFTLEIGATEDMPDGGKDYKIQDDWDLHASLKNNVVPGTTTPADNGTVAGVAGGLTENGVQAIDKSGAAMSIDTLDTTGHEIHINKNETRTFTFEGTVKDPIEPIYLEGPGNRIVNQFVVTTKDTPAVSESAWGTIKTAWSTLEGADIDKIVLREDDLTDPTLGGEVDTEAFGTLTTSPTDGSDKFQYTVSLKNITSNAMTDINVSDILPDEDYLVIDPTQIVTFEFTSNAGTAGVPGDGTILSTTSIDSDITAGTAKVQNLVDGFTVTNLAPHEEMKIKFDIQLSSELYSDPKYDVFTVLSLQPSAYTFKNIASICDGTNCKFDDAVTSLDTDTIDPDPIDPLIPGDNDYDKIGVIKRSDITGDVKAGDTVKYRIDLFNLGTETVNVNVYDGLEDAAFADSSDSNSLTLQPITLTDTPLTSLPANTFAAQFVTSSGAVLTPNPTVADLHSTSGVNVEMGPNSAAEIEFEIEITDELPAVTSTDDSASALENKAIACDSDKTSIASGGYTAMGTLAPGCDDDGNKINFLGVSKLSVVKDVIDKSGDKTMVTGDLGTEELSYTITVTNESPGTTVNYSLKDILSDPVLDLNPAVTSTIDVTVTYTNPVDPSTPLTDTFTLDQMLNTELADTTGLGGTTYDFLTLEPYESATYTFTVPTKVPSNPIFLGAHDVINNACVSYETVDPADKTSTLVVESCDDAVEKFNGGSENVVGEDKFTITKNMDDVAATATDDGIADIGEDIHVEFTIHNESTKTVLGVTSPTEITVNIMELAPLDTNIDYALSAANEVTVTGATVVSPTSSPLTVANLVADSSGTLTPTTGLKITIPADGIATIGFDVTLSGSTASGAAVWTPATEIYNIAGVCPEATTAFDPAKCDPVATTMDTPGFEDLSITKTVDSGKTDSVSGNPYTDGSDLTYTITVENTGSIAINPLAPDTAIQADGLYVQDTLDSEFFDLAATGANPLTITIVNPVSGTTNVDNSGTAYTVSEILDPTLSTKPYLPVELEPEGTITLSFDAVLVSNIGDKLDDGEMIPNLATVCYDIGAYNVSAGDVGSTATSGDVCYDAGVEIPFDEDGTGVTEVDDPRFTIAKSISDTSGTPLTGTADGDLEPGEGVVFDITVLNNGEDDPSTTTVDESGDDLIINVTDEMFDTAFDYFGYDKNGTVGAMPVTITNSTIISGATLNVKAKATVDTTTDIDTTAATSITSLDATYLLPLDAKTSNIFGAKDRWGASNANILDTVRGGIQVKVPANQQFTLSFSTNASGDLKTASKVRTFFDFKRFFR